MRHWLLFLLLLLLPNSILGQQKIIDSLEYYISDPQRSDREKIIPLSELVAYSKSDTVKAFHLGQQAIALAKRQKDAQYEVYAYSYLGLYYSLQGRVPKTYEYIDYTQSALDQTSVPKAQAVGYNKIGLMKLYLGDNEGIEAIYKSILHTEKNDYSLQALNYCILTNYYLSDIRNAEKYSKLAVEKALKSKDPHSLCYAWSIRGVRFLAEFEKTRQYELLDHAQVSLKNALSVYDQNPGYVSTASSINITANLLYSYQFKNEIKPDPKNLEAVRFYLDKTLSLPVDHQDEDFMINHYTIRIKAAVIQQDLLTAETLFHELITLVSTYPRQFRNKYELHHQLALLYEKMERFPDSNRHFKEAFTYYQQYYSDKYTKIGQQQHAKFEISKKEIEFEEKQHLLYLSLATITVVLIFLTAFILNYVKHKKRAIQWLEKLSAEEAKNLEAARVNAELQAQIKTEETHRLQKKMLAKNIQVSHKNEILQNLKNHLQNTIPTHQLQLDKILKNERFLDQKFEDYDSVIQTIHPDFYSRLQEKAQQKLTALDLKYCVYIYMKMPSKEMADLLYVELKTIRMNKYRLKIKLNLKKEDDLEAFIQNII